MSRENVEMARRAYEAFNRGDREGMVADFAPNFEYVTTGTIPGARGAYRGPGAGGVDRVCRMALERV